MLIWVKSKPYPCKGEKQKYKKIAKFLVQEKIIIENDSLGRNVYTVNLNVMGLLQLMPTILFRIVSMLIFFHCNKYRNERHQF